MSLEKYLSQIEIPAYKICMQCTESASHGIILSCLLLQMNANCEEEGVVLHDKIIQKHTKLNINDIWLFQAYPPSFIKTTLLNPEGLWAYNIDTEYLSKKFEEL